MYRGHPLGRSQGGVFFLRPCPAILGHMLQLLETNEDLRFTSESPSMQHVRGHTAVQGQQYSYNVQWFGDLVRVVWGLFPVSSTVCVGGRGGWELLLARQRCQVRKGGQQASVGPNFCGQVNVLVPPKHLA